MKRQGLSYLAVIGFVFLLVFGRAFAQGSPVEMIQSLANRLVTKLAQSKSVLRSSRADQFINSQVNAITIERLAKSKRYHGSKCYYSKKWPTHSY
jgi:hypothetical protein